MNGCDLARARGVLAHDCHPILRGTNIAAAVRPYYVTVRIGTYPVKTKGQIKYYKSQETSMGKLPEPGFPISWKVGGQSQEMLTCGDIVLRQERIHGGVEQG